jgi:hypothetical protein
MPCGAFQDVDPIEGDRTMRTRMLPIVAVLATCLLAGCVTHVHRDAPSWRAYKKAHPEARFVVVHQRPAADRTCWKLRRGWRCVVR